VTRTAATGFDNEYAGRVAPAGIARIRHETLAVAIGSDALMYSAKRTGGDRHLESQIIG
jgi:hypothetical protein